MIIVIFLPVIVVGAYRNERVISTGLPRRFIGKNIKLGKELALVGMFDKEKKAYGNLRNFDEAF